MDGIALLRSQALRSKYLGAAGLVFLLYDHVLSFADEVEYIWKARWTVPKLLFLLVRYTVPCALVLHTYQLAGMKPEETVDRFCQVWFNLAVILGILSIATGNFLVLLRLWILWKRNRRIILCTFPLFVAAQITVLACAIIVLVRVSPSLSFDKNLRLCTIQQRSILGALFAPPVMFDGLALLCVCWHALSRPRNTKCAIVQYLCEDRFIYIFLLFVLRLTNLATTLFGPLHMVFLGICFIWALTTVTVSRLILDLRKHASHLENDYSTESRVPCCRSTLESIS